jgi:hypothetical protein
MSTIDRELPEGLARSKTIIRLPSSVALRDIPSMMVALDRGDEVRFGHLRYA